MLDPSSQSTLQCRLCSKPEIATDPIIECWIAGRRTMLHRSCAWSRAVDELYPLTWPPKDASP